MNIALRRTGFKSVGQNENITQIILIAHNFIYFLSCHAGNVLRIRQENFDGKKNRGEKHLFVKVSLKFLKGFLKWWHVETHRETDSKLTRHSSTSELQDPVHCLRYLIKKNSSLKTNLAKTQKGCYSLQ